AKVMVRPFANLGGAQVLQEIAQPFGQEKPQGNRPNVPVHDLPSHHRQLGDLLSSGTPPPGEQTQEKDNIREVNQVMGRLQGKGEATEINVATAEEDPRQACQNGQQDVMERVA